jgi:hypothetical protein
MSHDLAALALRAMLTLSPLAAPRETLPGWDETQEARWHRYRSIADDVGAAAEQVCSARPEGAARDRCGRWSVAGLVGVAYHESGFAPDVDAGECYRGGAHAGRCDGGASVSLWQIRVGGEEGALYRRDRRAAATEALRRMGRSMNACRGLPTELRLSAFAGGRCVADGIAAQRSRELWRLIERAETSTR